MGLLEFFNNLNMYCYKLDTLSVAKHKLKSIITKYDFSLMRCPIWTNCQIIQRKRLRSHIDGSVRMLNGSFWANNDKRKRKDKLSNK